MTFIYKRHKPRKLYRKYIYNMPTIPSDYFPHLKTIRQHTKIGFHGSDRKLGVVLENTMVGTTRNCVY
jgi:hypothetical protein